MMRSCGFVALALLTLSGTGGAAVSPRASGGVLPPPSLAPAAGWVTRTSGPTNTRDFAPEVKAASDRGGASPAQLFNFFVGLRKLTPNGIVIWASTSGRGGATPVFTKAHWPLRLSSFRVDHGWEGQPAVNVQQRLRWVVVDGWHLDVRVYFGTQRPSKALLARAQAELDRLRLPR
jgi:hypothetical protein